MMKCPRCEAELEMGTQICPYCGIKFKYRQPKSKCKRSTACILAYVFGLLGIHNYYLGYIGRGALKTIAFIMFCAFFLGPQLVNMSSHGVMRITFDAYGVLGLFTIPLLFIMWAWSGVELFNLVFGKTDTDNRNQKLQD